jgi:hypothetical protein
MSIKDADKGAASAAKGDEAVKAADAAAVGAPTTNVAVAAIGPTGPNPDKPQSVPPGTLHLNGRFVQPQAQPVRTIEVNGERRKSRDGDLVFYDGQLMTREDAVAFMPELTETQNVVDPADQGQPTS